MAEYVGEAEGVSGGGTGGMGGTPPAPADWEIESWRVAREVLADPEAPTVDRAAAQELLRGAPEQGFLEGLGEAVTANLRASPGENPQPWAPPPTPEQALADRAGATARAEQPPAPSTSTTVGVSGNFGVAPISANTAGLRTAEKRIGEIGALTAAGIEEAGGRLSTAIGDTGAAGEQLFQAEADRKMEAQRIAERRTGIIDAHVLEIRRGQEEVARRRAAADELLKSARDVTAHPGLPPEKVAELVDRREALTADLARGRPTGDQAAMIEFNTRQKELADVNAKLDKATRPRGEWDFDNPEEIFAAIAMAFAQGMGAFGSAMTGAPNYAMQIAQARAKRIADQQKDEIARRKGLEGDVINDLDRYMQVFGDERAAEQAIFLSELSCVDAALESFSLGTSSEVVQAQIAKDRAAVAAKIAEVEIDVKNKVGQTITDSQAKAAAISSDATKHELSALEANQTNAAMSLKVQQKQMAKQGESWISGLEPYDPAHPPTVKDKEKMQEWYPKHQDVQRARSELIRLRKNPSVWAPDAISETAAAAMSAWSDLINASKDVKGMGANFTEMEKELLVLKEGGSPRALLDLVAKLEYNMKEDMIRAENKLRVYNYRMAGSGDDLGEVAR